MTIPMILSLSGKKGSGKNTLADYATERYGYKQIAWADELRHEVTRGLESVNYYNTGRFLKPNYPDFIWTLLVDCYDEVGKVKFSDYVYSKPTPPKLRILLQQWGTEMRRAQDHAYWLKKLRLEPSRKYVITDTRFQNEVDLLTVFGSLNIMIKAYGFPEKEADTHASEKLELTKMDYEVSNEYGNQDYLFKQLDSIIGNAENKTIERVSFVEWDENASK